jgi:hypothetical protein
MNDHNGCKAALGMIAEDRLARTSLQLFPGKYSWLILLALKRTTFYAEISSYMPSQGLDCMG